MLLLEPPCTAPDAVVTSLRGAGHAVLAPEGLCALAGVTIDELDALHADWEELPPDEHLKDGGHYRRRRHACFTSGAEGLTRAPHRAHFQPIEYNALHGGMERWFEPIRPASLQRPAWAALLRTLGGVSSSLHPEVGRWFIEAHALRIDTTDGIGRPTPEGAHRDGVDVVAVLFMGRRGVKGGETRLFEADGPNGTRFTMSRPYTLLLLDDRRVIHESTPIQPLVVGEPGHRDTLVVTLRRDGFQSA